SAVSALPPRPPPPPGPRPPPPPPPPSLRVRQLAPCQRRRQPRQPAQRPRHPHPLPRRPRVQPRPPGQPVGAGAAAVPPPAPRVELADQVEQPRGRGVEVSRELGDLLTEPVHLRHRRRVWTHRRKRHGEPPASHPTTRFSTDLGACPVATFRTGMIFASTHPSPGATGRCGAQEEAQVVAAT